MATIFREQPELLTERLRLRPLERSDAGLIHLYASDVRVAQMTTAIPHPYPPGCAEALVARARAADARETVWALDTGGENGLIGLVSAKTGGEGVAELGYWVAPAFWNAGYAGEALEAVAAELARQGFATLTAQVFQDNLASARVLTRAGFAYEGEGEAHSVARAAMVPTFLYRRQIA